MAENFEDVDYDIAIIGAGAPGLAAACALSLEGLQIVCFDKKFGFDGPKEGDTRTIALLQNSVYLLQNLGAWEACQPFAQPLDTMKVVDRTGRFPRVPDAVFNASEISTDPFGYNIPNDRLVTALADQAQTDENISLLQTSKITSIENFAHKAVVTPEKGNPVTASLIIGADGANSLARREAGIKTSTWDYHQTALACWFSHSLPHHNVSTEYHRQYGPLVIVPMQGNQSGLVWVEAPAEADRLMLLDEKSFRRELEQATDNALGNITDISARSAFSLSGLVANRFAKGRTALVSHAAHVLPPIGAQGLNLGLRDAAMIADLAGKAFIRGDDPGGLQVIAAYDQARRRDIMSRTFAVDFLNRSLLHGWFTPLQASRAIGVQILNMIPPLRKAVMREGIAPQNNLPPLMQAR